MDAAAVVEGLPGRGRESDRAWLSGRRPSNEIAFDVMVTGLMRVLRSRESHGVVAVK